MRKSDALALRSSQIKSRLRAIAELTNDDVTAEVRSEADQLGSELETVEVQYRAALASDEPEKVDARAHGGDDAEIRSLQSRAELRTYLDAAIRGAHVSGAEAELQAARGLSGNVVPWDALAPREARADTVTAPSSGNVGEIQQTIIQRVFARAATAVLGVSMPSAAVGEATYPVITAGVSPAFVASSTAKDAEAATLTPVSINPTRLQARYLFKREDTARIKGFESALRADLSMALSDALDAQIIGEGDAQQRGFLATSANGGLADVTAPTVATTFTSAAESIAEGVDGIYAQAESDCACVIGDETYRRLAAQFQTGSGVASTAYLRSLCKRFVASANVPDVASMVQDGILARTAGGVLNAICPVWQGVTLIRDEVTQAAKGHIALTAVALYGFKVTRPSAFLRLRFKLS